MHQRLGRIFSHLGIASLFLPVILLGTEVGYGSMSKPMNLVLSDITGVFMVILLAILSANKTTLWALISRQRVVIGAVVACSLYFLGIAFYTSRAAHEIVPLLSSLQYIKTFVWLIAGLLAARFLDCNEMKQSILWCAGITLMVLLFSDIFFSASFPRPRWGSTMFGFDILGFPNMAATFYAMCGLSILYLARHNVGTGLLFFYAFLLVVMTVSRSSMISMMVGVVAISLFRRNYAFPAFLIITFLAILLAARYGHFGGLAFLKEKAGRMEGGDLVAGRFGIWIAAWEGVKASPMFGHGFQPFSDMHVQSYADIIFSTPHQQYLELLYKSGAIGLALYGFILYAMLYPIIRYKGLTKDGIAGKDLQSTVLAWAVTLMVGNCSQPNFTYPCTVHLFFFLTAFMSVKAYRPLKLCLFAPAETETADTVYAA